VVKTGARAASLSTLLTSAGYRLSLVSSSPPRLGELSSGARERVLGLYRSLGGVNATVDLRPGGWDLVLDADLAVELDEELHFNRYRAVTLEPAWAAALPWRDDYLVASAAHEGECLAAGRWGKRWTNPSCEKLFGPGDPPGTFNAHGAPRWKQRALYDAMKDVAALDLPRTRLARISTVDRFAGIELGLALNGRAKVDLDALRDLLERRTLVGRSVGNAVRVVAGDRSPPRRGSADRQ
jgi:hypothetical protein